MANKNNRPQSPKASRHASLLRILCILDTSSSLRPTGRIEELAWKLEKQDKKGKQESAYMDSCKEIIRNEQRNCSAKRLTKDPLIIMQHSETTAPITANCQIL